MRLLHVVGGSFQRIFAAVKEDGSVVTWAFLKVLMDAHLGHSALGRLGQLCLWCDSGLCRGMFVAIPICVICVFSCWLLPQS